MGADHVVVNVAWGQPEQLSGVSEQCSHIPGVTLLILTFVSVSWAQFSKLGPKLKWVKPFVPLFQENKRLDAVITLVPGLPFQI